MKVSRIFVGLLSATIVGLIVDSARSCVKWPPGFPRGCITFNATKGCFEARVKGYTTMGALQGESCACGLGNASPGFLGAIKRVRLVFAGTNTDVPGFVWSHNSNASAAWQAAGNKPFTGFVAPITSPVPSGLHVDFIFEVSRRGTGGKKGIEQQIDKSCLGTDEWDPKANGGKGGLKKTHFGIRKLKSKAPDLVIRNLNTSSRSLHVNQTLSLRATTANIGTDAAISTDTVFVLSTDATITTGDRLLAFYPTGPIAANSSVTRVIQGRVPWCTPSGSCWIGAIADGGASEVEASESNNTSSIAARCAGYAGPNPFVTVRPQYPNVSFDTGVVSASKGGRVKICMLSPKHVGHFYLTTWSASRNYKFDALSAFALGQTNNPVFHNWFGVIGKNGQGTAEFNLGNGIGVQLRGPIVGYLHGFWISPSFRLSGEHKHPYRGHVTILK